MKTTLTILGTLFVLTTFGQTNLDNLKRDENGAWVKIGETKSFSGEFVEYYPNKQLKGKGTFKNGVVEGYRIAFFENGDTSFYRNYSKGNANGHSKEFYPHDIVKGEGNFVDAKEEGTWKYYYESGKLQAIVTYKKGVQDGDYVEYNSDGSIKAKYVMKDGKATYGKDIDDLVDKALQHSRKWENEEAIALYDKAIAINPTIAQLYFNRGTCKLNIIDKKFLPEAIKDFDKAIELKPDYMEAYANRGNAKINQFTRNGNISPTSEETKSACEDFQKARQLGDTSIDNEDMLYLYCGKK